MKVKVKSRYWKLLGVITKKNKKKRHMFFSKKNKFSCVVVSNLITKQFFFNAA